MLLSNIGRLIAFATLSFSSLALAQTAPSNRDIAGYDGLHQAAHSGDVEAIVRLIDQGVLLEERDAAGRTPLHVAAFASHENVVRALADAGANLNALEDRAYDVVTIASVENDLEMLKTVLELGASAKNITSPYDGTALIAAAHLGHHEVVSLLLESGAPIDHVNNLDWTALIEAVVLGDGGSNHSTTVRLLLEAGADRSIGDAQGVTPLEHARTRGFVDMGRLLESAD